MQLPVGSPGIGTGRIFESSNAPVQHLSHIVCTRALNRKVVLRILLPMDMCPPFFSSKSRQSVQ